jgi:hypothetical protein
MSGRPKRWRFKIKLGATAHPDHRQLLAAHGFGWQNGFHVLVIPEGRRMTQLLLDLQRMGIHGTRSHVGPKQRAAKPPPQPVKRYRQLERYQVD